MKLALRELILGPAFNVYALVIDGKCETESFLAVADKNDEDEWASMLSLLDRVSKHGPPKNEQKSRDVGGDVLEFKAKSLRICYFFDAGRMIICTHGFQKPTKKVQNREIKQAIKIHSLYLEMKKKGKIPIEKKE